MSKRSLFWGHGSGKLGEAVYYRAGGEQRTRAYTAIVKNPRSYAQALQRTQFNYVVAAYKSVKGVVDNYYLQRKSNQSAFNAFFKDNFPIVSMCANKALIDAREAALPGVSITKGRSGINFSVSRVDAVVDESAAVSVCAVPCVPFDVTSEISEDMSAPVVLVTGNNIYNAITNKGADMQFGAEFDLFLVVGIAAGDNIAHEVYKVHCSAESSDKIHAVWTSADVMDDSSVGRTVGVFCGGGSYVKGTSSSAPKMVKAKYLIPCLGEPGSLGESWEGGVFISFRSSDGQDVTDSRIVTSQDWVTDYVNPYQPEGVEGQRIIAEYTGLQKGL